MKVTKVAKTRIAVSGKSETAGKRGVLYPTPNATCEVKTVEEQISERVKQANRLYGVFFRSDIPFDLKKHFQKLVEIAANSKNAEEFKRQAKAYEGYEKKNRDGEVKLQKVRAFSYGSPTKNMKLVMNNYVIEQMVEEWNQSQYRHAASEVLLCICDKAYDEKIDGLQTGAVTYFIEASKSYPKPYIGRDTSDLEKIFSQIMKMLACREANDVSEKISWLRYRLKSVRIKGENGLENVELRSFRYRYATDERLNVVLVRMRKALKRGTNGEVAIRLMQGIAQMDGKSLPKVIDELCANEETRHALEKYIHAVEADYHKTHIIKSIKNHDVKVQVHDEGLDLASVKNKGTLTDTLERYAASPESSVETLKMIKEVFFDYFMWLDTKVKAEYINENKLWSVPNRADELFDMDFEPVDDKKDEKPEARETLEALFSCERVNKAAIKRRIKYVNCGKFQQLMKNETDEFRIYWLTYAKNYVEKNYVNKKREYKKIDCNRTRMLLDCWKDAVRFVCGKYIDIGKAVYHFAIPKEISSKNHVEYGVLSEKYQNGISSFAYEAIKAEENIQRDIAKATVAATSSFSRSILDDQKHQQAIKEREKMEDILFMSEEDVLNCCKEGKLVVKQLLRFFGGYSKIEGREDIKARELVLELLSHIKAIRNENFHFTKGKSVQLKNTYSKLLWENESKEYKQVIKGMYYYNNTAMFYPKDKLVALVTALYEKSGVSEAQIPSFRTVWPRKILPEYTETIPVVWDKTSPTQVIYEGALYFLLKEIYYRDFIFRAEAKELFFEAVDAYTKEVIDAAEADKGNREKKAQANSGKNFKEYVDNLQEKNLTLGQVCQFINTEYTQQNNSNQEVEIYKHFKLLLPLCLRNAFQQYIDKYYDYIKKPIYVEQATDQFLEEVDIICMEMKPDLMHWFTFAHFIHPRQLTFLVGDFKDYIQYRQDVVRRAGYAGELLSDAKRDEEEVLVKETVQKAKGILEVLEFVRNISGRVSREFTDYYPDMASFKKYMYQYFEEDVIFENYDIYADTKNARLLRNVELARMYAGGDLVLPTYPKITKAEVERYYAEKTIVAQIQSKGTRRSKEEQERVIAFQRLKGRITLCEVTDLFSLVNDLLGKLVSLAYLRERDEMYLYLGFYYMALRNLDGWTGEVLDSVKTDKYAVDKGLVLYQLLAVYDYNIRLLYQDKTGRWQETTGKKGTYFFENHAKSCACVSPLFEVAKYAEKTSQVRNYVDHFKYYVDYKWSILDLYSQFYTNAFGYSSKLRKSVIFNLQTMLERYFIAPKLIFDGAGNIILDKETTSQNFTYKYEEVDAQTNQMETKSIEIPAKSEAFMNAVRALLQYKR